jgi:hypothetical protein
MQNQTFMSPKVRNIIGWVLSGILAALFIMAGTMSIMLTPEHKAEMVKMGMTVSDDTTRMLGVLQILCVVLFLIPRTGVLGTLMVTAWIGGAICFHVIRSEPFYIAAVMMVLVWIIALMRFPEIGWRLFRGHIPTS